MAYNFVRASGHHIDIDSFPDLTSQLSLSVHVKNASAVAGGGSFEERIIFTKFKNGDGNDRNFQFDYRNNGGNTGPMLVWTSPVSSFITYQDIGTFLTVDTWFHFLVTVDWTTNPDTVALYFDGSSHSLTRSGSDNATPTTGATQVTKIGGYATGEWDGDLAELAIWDTVLTASEAAALKKASPLVVHPNNLVFYAPLVRDLIDLKGHGLTNNSATVSTHPPIIRS